MGGLWKSGMLIGRKRGFRDPTSSPSCRGKWIPSLENLVACLGETPRPRKASNHFAAGCHQRPLSAHLYTYFIIWNLTAHGKATLPATYRVPSREFIMAHGVLPLYLERCRPCALSVQGSVWAESPNYAPISRGPKKGWRT